MCIPSAEIVSWYCLALSLVCFALQVDSTKHTLAKYLLELSILDYQLVHVHPSEVSAACLCMSIRLLDYGISEEEEEAVCWDDTLHFYSTYSEQHLQPIMNRLALLVSKSATSKHQVISASTAAALPCGKHSRGAHLLRSAYSRVEESLLVF